MERELASTPDVQADVLTLIGRLFVQLGVYTDARPLLEGVLALRRELYGDVRKEIGETLDSLPAGTGYQSDARVVYKPHSPRSPVALVRWRWARAR